MAAGEAAPEDMTLETAAPETAVPETAAPATAAPATAAPATATAASKLDQIREGGITADEGKAMLSDPLMRRELMAMPDAQAALMLNEITDPGTRDLMSTLAGLWDIAAKPLLAAKGITDPTEQDKILRVVRLNAAYNKQNG
jgi:hypothetical protein